MQVVFLLLILLSDSFALGLRERWHYSTTYAVMWVLGSLFIMTQPYFRSEQWTDE